MVRWPNHCKGNTPFHAGLNKINASSFFLSSLMLLFIVCARLLERSDGLKILQFIYHMPLKSDNLIYYIFMGLITILSNLSP